MEHKIMADEWRPLTVRETFALVALEGMLAHGFEAPPMAGKAETRHRLAQEAWAIADAMLQAQASETKET